MANPGQPSANIAYDPLPLTGQDQSNALYNAPASPGPQTTHFSGAQDPYAAVPPGAGQPRFMAAPLYDAPNPALRDSFASTSQRSIPGATTSEYGSVYALNDTRGGGYRDDPSGDGYRDNVPMSPVGHSRALTEKNDVYAPPKAKSRRTMIILGSIVGLILIAAAIVVPLYFTVIKKKDADSSNSSDSSSKDHGHKPDATKPTTNTPVNVVSGGDGSEITMEDGTTFIYRNPFGGYWHYDPNDPYSGGGKAQSWSPAINETFNYGIDKIRGVNVGGWLNPEPFIAPALYEKYLTNAQPAVDEWTLCEAMAADTAGGGLNQMEDHYRTFITERDFAEIAAAGLNYVRLPIGFWAVEKRPNEPYLEGVSWQYVIKAIKWGRKYGLRINLDLHAAPGSQNGWNHSGRMGTIGFLQGPMGYANAQRTLNIIRIIAEFIAQPQYKDVVTMFGILNEPQGTPMGQSALASFYLEAYNIVRNAAGGPGEANGPWISLHDGFLPRQQWAGIFPNADRLSLDSHPYLAFGAQSASPMSSYARTPCTAWAASINQTMRDFGLFNAGEFSNAVTDCGLFLNEVNGGTRYEGDYIRGSFPRVGSCTPWTDWPNYSDQMKTDIRNFALASMDALQHYFFWTWKIGNSSRTGRVETPAWSYQLGWQEGWMPLDPRDADGVCGNTDPWTPPLAPWQTGGVGAGDIPASVTAAYPWPPAAISQGGAIADMPQYTPTGSIITLSAPTMTAVGSETMTRTANPGNGWNNPADTEPIYVEIAGCTYPDPWMDPAGPLPPRCANAPVRREPVPTPVMTPAPA